MRSWLLVFSLFSSILCGCSLDIEVQSARRPITEIIQVSAKTTEITPASIQNVYSSRGARVQASLNYADTSVNLKTHRGYKVFTNVQGTLFKGH